VYTCTVHDKLLCTCTKLHARRVPNVGVAVRVGVGPVEFQLDADEPLFNERTITLVVTCVVRTRTLYEILVPKTISLKFHGSSFVVAST